MSAVVNALTVDVEDYFHASAFDRMVSRPSWSGRDSRVVRNTEILLECFDRAGVHATFFVLGWVGARFPQLVRDIAAAGHEIAAHGYYHQLVYTLTADQFRDDVRRARATLEDISGGPIRGYRAPSFSITHQSLWALDVLVEEGYGYDASIFPIRHDRYGIPDAPRQVHVRNCASGAIVEVPGPTVRVAGRNVPIAGGGYFRLYPYACTRWGISRVNRAGDPVVFYLHPWEIDPDQPRLPAPRLTALRHYIGLRRTLNRLERLFTDFAFDTVAATLATERSAALPALGRLAHAK
jgi:polysaccharide deacetylase family protein (PEP-CTERM system associated)